MRFPFQAPPTYLLSNNVINQDIVVKNISTTKYVLSQTIVTMICKNKEPEISFQPFNPYLSLATINFCSSNNIFLILNPNKEQIACLSLLSNW